MTGLVLLTTDGQLAHRLISPRWKAEKQYRARCEGALDAGYGCMVLFEDAGTADREGKAPKRLPDYRIHAIPELLDLFPLRK